MSDLKLVLTQDEMYRISEAICFSVGTPSQDAFDASIRVLIDRGYRIEPPATEQAVSASLFASKSSEIILTDEIPALYPVDVEPDDVTFDI